MPRRAAPVHLSISRVALHIRMSDRSPRRDTQRFLILYFHSRYFRAGKYVAGNSIFSGLTMHCPVENTFWEGMPHPAATRHLETNIDVAGRGRGRFLLRPYVVAMNVIMFHSWLARESRHS